MIHQMERERVSSTSAAAEFDEEEAKMEKFYELIRRYNEARAYHLRNQVEDYRSQEQTNRNHNHNCGNQSKGVKLDNNKTTTPNFIPSFKWEDFRDVFGNREEDDHVDVSDKSGNELLLLQPSSNFVDDFDKSNKKRKINELIEGDNDNENENGGYEIDAAVARLKSSRPQLDLNLAL